MNAAVPVGSHVARYQRRLLREAPWCSVCGIFGRREGPDGCTILSDEELTAWADRGEAVIATWAVIKNLWPEVAQARHVSPKPPAGESIIDRIKAAYRVEDIARRLTDLRGNHTLTGKCPLHREVKGRSFVVWTDIQRWRCYGACQKSGDVIDLWRAARAAGYAL